jgi:hypothetical protein
MNLTRAWTFLALLAPLAACDPADKCIADCGAAGSTGDEPGTGDADPSATSTDDGTGPTPRPAGCAEAEVEATAWVEANRACTYLTDCTQLDAICYQGSSNGTCGNVAVSADADASQWDALHDTLTECGECGAAACGEAVTCTDEGSCSGIGPGGDLCPDVDRDIARFLDENRACTTDDDCMLVAAECYDGPERACTDIAISVTADADTWNALHEQLSFCVDDCGGPDCGASVSCGPQGLCIATFP